MARAVGDLYVELPKHGFADWNMRVTTEKVFWQGSVTFGRISHWSATKQVFKS